ncbi:DUF6518 family protein [Streptomyces cyaneofuscatus]|uniref:DUF6518 family protein n=1 Tax=Streptomyces cyaneofuscatus TaxID=66883 RepID=UPI001F48E5D3|nr:DUF6518 family protein [Streptomyces sp. SID2119]
MPDTWQQLANSGAVWSAVAFAVGAVLYRQERIVQAASGGAVAEVGLVVGYYGYAEFGRDGAGRAVSSSRWCGWGWRSSPGPCSARRAGGGGAGRTCGAAF